MRKLAKIRYLPFGYRISGGKIAICEEEAECVQEAFMSYAQGLSYAAIARKLQQKGIPYHAGTPLWNKHMIKRMLENERYAGTDAYPQITDAALFEGVTGIRKNRTPAPIRKRESDSPPMHHIDKPIELIPDISVQRLENQINHELSRPVMEPERLRNKIFELASKKYNAYFEAANGTIKHGKGADSARFNI